jgi:lipoate-protein ligase A
VVVTLTLWHDGPHDAPANMARDAVLLERAAAGALPGTVLRLFTFAPAGITLGRAQVATNELDLARLERDGVRWATRPTGGRAIWHEEEWTFSLVTTLTPAGWAMTPAAAYERTGRLLASAFQSLGVPAVLAAGGPRGPGAPRARAGAAPPCFASTARHELVLEGRKLAGIAQRAVRGALLQQGSLLLGDTHARLADYVAVPDAEREALRAEWRRSAATAGARLGADRSLERLTAALVPLLPGARLLRGEAGAGVLLTDALPRRSS